jgi:hypothetical protein
MSNLLGELLCSRNICNLCTFVSAAQQNQLFALLAKINPITGPEIIPQLADGFADWLHIPGTAHSQTLHAQDNRTSAPSIAKPL